MTLKVEEIDGDIQINISKEWLFNSIGDKFRVQPTVKDFVHVMQDEDLIDDFICDVLHCGVLENIGR